MIKILTATQEALILEILAANDTMAFATLRPDGFPQSNTVTYVNDGLTIYFGTWDSTQKVRNLAYSDKVSCSLEGYDQDWNKIRGLSFGGTAEVVTQASEIVKIYELMDRKFPQIKQFPIPDFGAALVVRIKPVVASIIDYSKGFLHSELVALPS